nr:immunoglobulin light chain junction region [Macaca mulatta]MOX35215.1 immunoglobulin light chain junction region [Macaca mulatta]
DYYCSSYASSYTLF